MEKYSGFTYWEFMKTCDEFVIGIHHRSGTWHRIAYEHTTCLVFCKIWSEINFTERWFDNPISENLWLWKWLKIASTNTTHIQIMHHWLPIWRNGWISELSKPVDWFHFQSNVCLSQCNYHSIVNFTFWRSTRK